MSGPSRHPGTLIALGSRVEQKHFMTHRSNLRHTTELYISDSVSILHPTETFGSIQERRAQGGCLMAMLLESLAAFGAAANHEQMSAQRPHVQTRNRLHYGIVAFIKDMVLTTDTRTRPDRKISRLSCPASPSPPGTQSAPTARQRQ
jgi:hypothetical protein